MLGGLIKSGVDKTLDLIKTNVENKAVAEQMTLEVLQKRIDGTYSDKTDTARWARIILSVIALGFKIWLNYYVFVMLDKMGLPPEVMIAFLYNLIGDAGSLVMVAFNFWFGGNEVAPQQNLKDLTKSAEALSSLKSKQEKDAIKREKDEVKLELEKEKAELKAERLRFEQERKQTKQTDRHERRRERKRR